MIVGVGSTSCGGEGAEALGEGGVLTVEAAVAERPIEGSISVTAAVDRDDDVLGTVELTETQSSSGFTTGPLAITPGVYVVTISSRSYSNSYGYTRCDSGRLSAAKVCLQQGKASVVRHEPRDEAADDRAPTCDVS